MNTVCSVACPRRRGVRRARLGLSWHAIDGVRRMGMVKVVGLVLHPRRDCGSAIDAIVTWAARREVTVLGLHDEINRIDCDAVPVSTEEMVERASMLVSLGGDGTMLRTMRLVEGRKTPGLGGNVGRVG